MTETFWLKYQYNLNIILCKADQYFYMIGRSQSTLTKVN